MTRYSDYCLVNCVETLGSSHFGYPSDIMVYLAMFRTTIDKIFCLLGPHKMKMSHYFQSLIPSGTWDFFDF